MPCKTLDETSTSEELERAASRQAAVYIAMPYTKIRFLPYISEALPNGTRNIAAARRNEIDTQLSKTASIANSLPIAGSAMLTEDIMNGRRKELSETTISAALCSLSLSMPIKHRPNIYNTPRNTSIY